MIRPARLRLAAALAALALSGCGAGEWEEVAEAEGAVISVDRERILPLDPGVYRVWERAEVPGRFPGLTDHRYALVDYDCAGERVRLVRFFQEFAPEVDPRTVPPMAAWTPVDEEGLGKRRLERVCALARARGEEG